MEEQDIYVQYLQSKIDRYETQIKGIVYHLNRHKEILRRLTGKPTDKNQSKLFKMTQLDLFGT